MMKLRTQKARGLFMLCDAAIANGHVANGPGGFQVIPGAPGNFSMEFPAFGRPCPVRPCHGFVASRCVRDALDALNLLAETLAADPEGELILMHEFTGRWSAVLNNAGIVWGLGNDGVTGGAVGSLLIPTPTSIKAWTTALNLRPTELEEHESQYLEAVENFGRIHLVQVRPGPALLGVAGAADFVPRRIKVRALLMLEQTKATNSLVKWDKLVRAARPGTVALLDPHFTRFSHFAVHCLAKQMPIIFHNTDDGEFAHGLIGSTLEPIPNSAPAPLQEQDYEYMARVIMQRVNPHRVEPPLSPEAAVEEDKWRVTTAIGTCHAAGAWGREEHLLRLRAEGVVACFSYAAAACVGEIRHFYRSGPGGWAGDSELHALAPIRGKVRHTVELTQVLSAHVMQQLEEGTSTDRDITYGGVDRLNLPAKIKLTRQCVRDFDREGWTSHFGGPRWAGVALQTAALGAALLSFCLKPEKRRWQRLLARYNSTVHSCHNSGRVLSKWITGETMSRAARAPALCFMNPFAAAVVLEPDDLQSATTLRELLRADVALAVNRIDKRRTP